MSERIVNSFLDNDDWEEKPKKEKIDVRLTDDDSLYFKKMKEHMEDSVGRKLTHSSFLLKLLEFYDAATIRNDLDENEALEAITRSEYINRKLNYIDLNTNKNLRLGITILQNIGLQGLDNEDNKLLEEFIEPLEGSTEASEISGYLDEQISDEIHRKKLYKKHR